MRFFIITNVLLIRIDLTFLFDFMLLIDIYLTKNQSAIERTRDEKVFFCYNNSCLKMKNIDSKKNCTKLN